MPGTIQVSVVGLMDLPKPETSSSSFTLKVAMGKREYHSNGQGDCSIPVVSIRDRLIVAIHDEEGNEIFCTEFKTISVVEKEVMEDSYPLKSGGYVNMKLQFLLSQEEHARIRKMRESALKRKRVEQIQTEMKDSESDTSGSTGTTSSQVSEQLSEDLFKIEGGQLIEARKENVKIQSPADGVSKWQVSAEVGLGAQFQTPRSLVSGDAIEHSNPDPSELKGNQENQTRSNVRKMVSAFESSKFQGPEPHFGPRMKSPLREVGVEGSLKRVPSVESDIEELKVPQAISKSFSSGMLSDMNSQQNPELLTSAFLKKQEEMEHVGPVKGWETTGKGKASLEPMNDMNLKSHGSVELKGVEETVKETAHSAKAVALDRFTENVKEGDDPVSIVSKKGHSALPLKRDFKEAEEILNLAVISKDYKISVLQTVSETSDQRTSSPSEVEAGSKYNPAADISSTRDSNNVGYEQSVAVNVALSQKVKLESAHMKEIQVPRKILDKSSRINHPGSPNTCQQVSALGATRKQNESECPGSHSEEEIVSAPPNVTADFLIYFGNDGCSLENDDVWTTRRLCLTTGTRQLRDLADCCTHCGGTHPIEKNSTVGSNYQKLNAADAG